jgi:hypothetical protein
VPGSGEKIYAQIPHVDRKVAGALGGIDQQQCAPPMGEPGDLSDRLHRSGDVGAVRQRNQSRVRAQRLRDITLRNHPFPVRLHESHLDTAAAHQVQRTQQRVVFHRRRDDMVSRLQKPAYRYVEGFGGTVGENQAGRVRYAEESGKSRTGFVDDAGCCEGLAVSPPARSDADLPHCSIHGPVDGIRFRE